MFVCIYKTDDTQRRPAPPRAFSLVIEVGWLVEEGGGGELGGLQLPLLPVVLTTTTASHGGGVGGLALLPVSRAGGGRGSLGAVVHVVDLALDQRDQCAATPLKLLSWGCG